MVDVDDYIKKERDNRMLLSEQMFYGKQLQRYPKRRAQVPKEEMEKQIAR